MASTLSSDRLSLVQLRASLHTMLSVDDVDDLTEGFPDHIDDSELAGVIRSARNRLFLHRLQRWITRSNTTPAPHSGIDQHLRSRSSSDLLLLVLHVGCDLTKVDLAELIEETPESIVQQLAIARQTLSEVSRNCTEHDPELLAGYRDGQADRVTTASITRRIAECEACQHDLDTFVRLDQSLSGLIDEFAARSDIQRPGTVSASRSLRTMVPVGLLAVTIVVVALASAGLVSALSGTATSSLLAETTDDEPDDHGRLIYGTWDGGMIAFDPVSGTREVVRAEYYTAHTHDGTNYLLSPGGNRVAIFAQGEIPGLHWATRNVQIVAIDGTTISELEWHESPEAGWPTGWLDDDELLSVSIPTYQTGETNESFLERLEDESRLRATDVITGEQRTVHQGAVAQVIPSPDGTRLAIVRPRDPVHPGPTVELWSVEDGIAAELLGSIDDAFTWAGGLLWREDSEAVFLGEIASFQDERDENSRNSAFRGQIDQITISAIDRDGNLETVVDPGLGYAAQIAGFHDTYDQLVYAQFPMDEPESDYSVHRYDLLTEETSQIELLQDEMRFRPTMAGTLGYQTGFAASPIDGSFMIHLGADHYLPSDMSYHAQDTPGVIHLGWINEHLELNVSTMMSDRWRVTPLRWMSNDEVSELLLDNQPSGYQNPTVPEPVEELRPYAQLGPDSTLSPDGAALPMVEDTDDELRPYLWFPLVQTGRWVASGTVDQTWHAGSHAMFGVTGLGPAGEKMSRLSQLSTSQRGGTSIDGFFDPHGINEDQQIRYAAPSASPDGLTTSYFTVDADAETITLWAYPANGAPLEISSFIVPEQRIDDYTPHSQWIDNQTLLYLEPASWDRVVPTRSSLYRATITEGDIEIVEVLALQPRGRERGVEIIEISVQPGGEYLAWRSRNYGSRNDPDDSVDSVSIARTSDLNDALEIDRSSPSSGLDWTPGGGALAVGTGERVSVYDIENHQMQRVSGSQTPAKYPVWLSDSDLWFNIGDDDDATVYRVRYTD